MVFEWLHLFHLFINWVSGGKVLGIKSDPFQQSTSQQFPASKGAGGRGGAFKYYMLTIDHYCLTGDSRQVAMWTLAIIELQALCGMLLLLHLVPAIGQCPVN